MSNLINLPGFNVSVAYDRTVIADAIATKVSKIAYKATYALANKSLEDSERVVATGQAVQSATIQATTRSAKAVAASIGDVAAEAKATSQRVAAATSQKTGTQLSQKIGKPVAAQYYALRAKQIEAHDQLRDRINEYCGAPSIKAELIPLLPEATSVEVPRKRRRTLSDVAIEAIAE
jgi:hypothetical protein